jgi:tRNA nucleotidyltransferase (CCA-adding enzyme)
MAYSPTRGYADPFGGRGDLEKGILRAVGNPEKRFQEDSLRILRGVRFAVRFGLTVDPATEKAMFAQASLMDNLARERVFDELCKLLPLVTAEDLIRFAPILAAVIPELKPMIGFDQRSPHHAYDIYTHVAGVVAGVPGDLTLRWAALLHDVGKVPTFTLDENGRVHFLDHAAKGAEMADVILRRLKAPNALRERVVLLIEKHMLWLVPEKKQLRRQIGRLGQETVYQILSLQQADNSNKGTAKSEENEKYVQILDVLEEIRSEDGCLSLKDLTVNGNDLMQIGFSGRSIGVMLNWLLEQVMEETLPNERSVLLDWAQRVWKESWQNS